MKKLLKRKVYFFRIPPSPFSLCPSQKGENVTAPPVALNRFALGLMDHQRSRQFFVRDGTAWGKVETIWGGLAIMGG